MVGTMGIEYPRGKEGGLARWGFECYIGGIPLRVSLRVRCKLMSSAFPEAFWAFDCVLVFWAIVKHGSDAFQSGGLRSALFAANCKCPFSYLFSLELKLMSIGFDVEPPTMWVEHGGQLILPFIGSSANFSTKDILRHCIAQLNKMPWGMAGMYKQVLEKLLQEEDA